jgi:hypothetical protein
MKPESNLEIRKNDPERAEVVDLKIDTNLTYLLLFMLCVSDPPFQYFHSY